MLPAIVLLLVMVSAGMSGESGAVAARSGVAELAGGFSADGFKARGGCWEGVVWRGAPVVVAVNLYAGNAYWFCAAAGAGEAALAVRVFDENGRPVETEPRRAGVRAAGGITASSSGQYFVQVALEGGPDQTECAFLYVYK